MIMTLTDSELIIAAAVASLRTINGRRGGNAVVNGQTADARDFNGHEALGIRGELLVARYLNRWPAGLNYFEGPKTPDVSTYVEVHTVSEPRRRLIVNAQDKDERAFVSVAWCGSLKFDLRGWIWTRDAKRAEWWQSLQANRPAFVVPTEALQPMESLRDHDRWTGA